MTEKKKPPAGEYSAFKKLLDGIAKVPKAEIDQKEREYQDDRNRPSQRRKKA